MTIDRLAELLGQSLAAEEAKLGTFPFPSYGVVEVPDRIGPWYAASQQTFIMANSRAFDFDHGNVSLWVHEMCHGWWGNSVGSDGAGSKIAGESLAQVGALIAIDGEDAMLEFLHHSRSGYNATQCGRGYFGLWRDGVDEALAQMNAPGLRGSNRAGLTHNLANSKGMWVYHMLRGIVGDEVFYGVLRSLIEDYTGKEMTLDDLRRRYIERAPGHDLESFFSQWLDRTGAPVLKASWTEGPRGVDLEGSLEAVTLDPRARVLLWRESYGPRP